MCYQSQTKPLVTIRSCLHLLIAFGLAVIALSGCASGPQPTADLETVLAKESQAKRHTGDINQRLFAAAKEQPKPDDYVLREGDLLQVTVHGEDDLACEVRIGGEGTVTLQLIGALKVAGLSAKTAEVAIENAYKQKYLRDPRVRIFVKEQHGSRVTVLGQVNKPGTYDYYSSQRLMYVLSMSGGLTDKAGEMVQVTRGSGDPEHPNTYFVDLDQLTNKGQSSLNIEIQGGDVIFVPEAGTVYVDGAVKKPGTYQIKPNMTIQEAIVAAGGFSGGAKESDIKIARLQENGAREVTQVGIKDVREGGATSLGLKDHDVIFVESNKLMALLYSLRLTAGYGMLGLGFQPSQ